MSSELPPNVAIEPVFFVEGVLAPDAEELRRPVRARHLERIAALREAGVVLEAGALGDLSTSVLIVRAADAEAAREIARQDVYLAAGVRIEIRVRPFGRVCRPGELAGA
jgi:uncharacterized protein YciI